MKVSYVLGVREILSLLKEDNVLADLKSGARGAPKMSGEQLAQLQQFGEMVNPLRGLKDKKFSMKRNLKQHIYNNHKEKEGDKESKSVKDSSTKNKESKKGKENNISQKKTIAKQDKPGNPTKKKSAEVLGWVQKVEWTKVD